MIPLTREARPLPTHNPATGGLARVGTHPIAVTAAALVLILAGVAGIAISRAYTGQSPETDRAVAVRALQARAAQASEQLAEKTKGLEQTQQDSVDQLQVMQDQLQTGRRRLAAQQADNKRLSEQVSSLTEAVEGLRQSFASAQSADASPAPAAHNRSVRIRAHATRNAQRRAKSHS
jgi:flagellar motility protein MotE (MotC chaperone)